MLKTPDARGWGLIGLFGVTTLILCMLDRNPGLSNNTLFVSIATLVVGSGGLLNALGYFYGSSQGSSKKDEALSAIASKRVDGTPTTPPT